MNCTVCRRPPGDSPVAEPLDAAAVPGLGQVHLPAVLDAADPPDTVAARLRTSLQIVFDPLMRVQLT